MTRRKNTKTAYSIAFGALFDDLSVTAILCPAYSHVEPANAMFRSAEEITDRLFKGSEPENASIFKSSHDLLTAGARATEEYRQKAFIVPVTLDDPIHDMGYLSAANEALKRIMLAARERHMAGYGDTELPRKGNPNSVVSIKAFTSEGYAQSFEPIQFGSNRMADLTQHLDQLTFAYTLANKPEDVKLDVEVKADAAQAEVSALIRGMFKGVASEALASHVPAPETFDALYQRAKQVGTERASKLDLIETDDIEFGRDVIAEYGGMPPDTDISYIASSFLEGLVNFGKNHVCMMIARYGMRNDDLEGMDFFESIKMECELADGYDPVRRVRELYQAHADKVYGKLTGDDWIVVYETDNSFYFMWFDRDVSDCSVARYLKTSAEEVGINNLDEFLFEALVHFSATGASFIGSYTALDEEVIVRANPKTRISWISF